jgi:hypothetical protein
MFVACTINVRDLKECQDVSSDTALVHESGARLDFGIEVFRQAGSTPSPRRCALIISRLLQGPIPKNGVPQITEHGQAISDATRSPGTATENKRPSVLVTTTGNKEEVSLSSFSEQPVIQYKLRDQRRPDDFSNAPSMPRPENSEQDTVALAHQSEASLSNGPFLGRVHVPLDPMICGSGVETPFR